MAFTLGLVIFNVLGLIAIFAINQAVKERGQQ